MEAALSKRAIERGGKMSGSEEHSSIATADDSFFIESSSAGESEDFLPDTTPYFEAWLAKIKPSTESAVNLDPASAQLEPPITEERPADQAEFRFEGTLRIGCYVTGNMHSQTGTLISTETGEIYADIFVATAIIDGLLHGDVHASERVELGSTARVIGNITTPGLSIQPGAVFEGQCHFFLSPLKQDSEEVAPTAVDDSTDSTDSTTPSRSIRSRPDRKENEEADELAVAAGR
jgi:cytoskeletal protein CcmA (bactofilin family)